MKLTSNKIKKLINHWKEISYHLKNYTLNHGFNSCVLRWEFKIKSYLSTTKILKLIICEDEEYFIDS